MRKSPLLRLVGDVAICWLALALTTNAVADGNRYVGEFAVTYYYVAVEDGRYSGEPLDQLLRDVDGCELAFVSRGFRRALDLEGTGRLADGRILNVATRQPDGWRYVDLGPASWGVGVNQRPLLPFRSVAADPTRLKSGQRLFIPAFAGLTIDPQAGHGGHFVVDDIGSAIRDARLDIFIGDEQHLRSFEAVVPSHGRTRVYAVSDETPSAAALAPAKPARPAVELPDDPTDLLRAPVGRVSQ